MNCEHKYRCTVLPVPYMTVSLCIHVHVQFNGALCITYMYVDVPIKLLYYSIKLLYSIVPSELKVYSFHPLILCTQYVYMCNNKSPPLTIK